MNGRYVVGVDGSRAALAALAWARDRIAETGGELVTVHVREDPARSRDADDEQEWLGSDPMVTLSGRVPETLAGYVDAGDRLVVGTGKSGFIHGRVFGVLPVQIAALAPSSVMVIPEADIRFREGIVAGVDRHETASMIAAAAAVEASREGDGLQLLQATLDGGGSNSVDLAVAAAELTVRQGWPDLRLRTRVVARAAAPALLDAARNAKMLILGPGREAPVDGHDGMPGRVLHDVLINVNVPVLILPRPAAGYTFLTSQ